MNKSSTSPSGLVIGICFFVILGFFEAKDVYTQPLNEVRSFTISDIGDPRSWRPGEVQVGKPQEDVTIVARDSVGEKVQSFSGTVYLTQYTDYGLGRISPDTVQLVDGEWTGPLEVYRSGKKEGKPGVTGDVWVSVSDNASIPHTGTSNLFTARPKKFSQLLIVLPGEVHAPGSVIGKSGSVVDPRVGVEFTIEVYATDRYGNQRDDIGHWVRLTSSDANATLQQDTNMDSGKVRMAVRLNSPGTQTITAFDLTKPEDAPPATEALTIRPGPAALFTISEIGAPASGRPGDITVGTAETVTVTAFDSAGNRVTDFGETVVLRQESDYGLGRISPDRVELTDGEWRGAIKVFRSGKKRADPGTIGDVWISVRDEATTPHIGNSNRFTAQAKPFSKLLIVLPGEEYEPGSNSGKSGNPIDHVVGTDFTIDIYATDEYSNQIENVFDTIQLTSTDPNAVFDRSIDMESGKANLSLRLNSPGTQALSAASSTTPSISPMTETLSVSTGGVASLGISADHLELAGLQETTVRVTVEDVGANPLPGQEVRFSIVSGTGRLDRSSALSDSAGRATVQFQGGQVSEINLVRAWIGFVQADIEIAVNMNPSNLADGVVLNYPNPFGVESESTRLEYYLPEDADVTLKIFDLLGNLVWRKEFAAGTNGGFGRANSIQPNSVEWSAVNDRGQLVANGGYILVARAIADRRVVMNTKRKIVILR